MSHTLTAPVDDALRMIPAGRVIVPPDAPREEWLAARTRGVTATDVRVLAGHGYRNESVFTRWQEKVGEAPPEPEETPLAWELGRDEEPILRKHAQRRYGVETWPVGLVESLWRPEWLCSPDLLAEDGALIETKHSDSGSIGRHFDRESPWTNEDGLTLPPGWLAQARWQRFVSGVHAVRVFAMLTDRRRFTSWTVEADDVEEDLLRALADTFWQHVQSSIPPPVEWDTVTAEEVRARYPSVVRETVVLGWDDVATALGALEERKAAGELISELEKGKKAAELKLALLAGDAERVVDPDGRELYSYPTRRRKGYVAKPVEYRTIVLPKKPKGATVGPDL